METRAACMSQLPKGRVGLQVEVEADAEGVVLAVVVIGLEDTRSHLACDVAAIVEGAHVAEVNIEVLGGMDAHTAANHVVREVEREVVHKIVAKSIACVFP